MRFISALATFLPLLQAAAAFEWTQPDPNNKLNLSAPEINLAWDPKAGSGGDYDQVDIWFNGDMSGGTAFGQGLVQNVSVATGEYAWDPKSMVDALKENNNPLLAGKVHYFEARLHPANSSSGASIESDKYEVEGYDNIVNGASVHSFDKALLIAVGGIMVMIWIL